MGGRYEAGLLPAWGSQADCRGRMQMCMNLRRAVSCWLSWAGQDWAGKLSGGQVKAEDASREFWALLKLREEAAPLLILRSHVKHTFSVMSDCL